MLYSARVNPNTCRHRSGSPVLDHADILVLLVVEVLGSAYAPPFMARLFKLALRLSGAWIGLPYYGLAFMLMISVILLAAVRLPKAPINTVPASETHDEEQ